MNVRETYDAIAAGFYHVRQKPVAPELYGVLKEWKPGLLLDVGCGTGTCALPFARAGFGCIGGDVSGRMLHGAKKYSARNGFAYPLAQFDCTSLPFASGSFDYAIAVAVLHHLETPEARLAALGEIGRVLKNDGEAFVTVWNKKPSEGKDVMVPWKHRGVAYDRYYHMFGEAELRGLAEDAGFVVAGLSVSKNICMRLEKMNKY